jgi:transcriptional regulator of acetoin/glycerol metabolism
MIQCRACECKQEPSPTCRRCGKDLMPQQKLSQNHQVRAAAMPFVVVPEPRPIIPFADLQRDAIENALRQIASPRAAAKALGISKNKIYRLMVQYGLRDAPVPKKA